MPSNQKEKKRRKKKHSIFFVAMSSSGVSMVIFHCIFYTRNSSNRTSCVRLPVKINRFAAYSLELWWFQSQLEMSFFIFRINLSIALKVFSMQISNENVFKCRFLCSKCRLSIPWYSDIFLWNDGKKHLDLLHSDLLQIFM